MYFLLILHFNFYFFFFKTFNSRLLIMYFPRELAHFDFRVTFWSGHYFLFFQKEKTLLIGKKLKHTFSNGTQSLEFQIVVGYYFYSYHCTFYCMDDRSFIDDMMIWLGRRGTTQVNIGVNLAPKCYRSVDITFLCVIFIDTATNSLTHIVGGPSSVNFLFCYCCVDMFLFESWAGGQWHDLTHTCSGIDNM